MVRVLVSYLDEHVLPDRLAQNNEGAKKRWWLYYRFNELCYQKLDALGVSFAAARTTKYLSFSQVRSGRIFTDAVYIFTTDRWDLFAVVQSTLHEIWARKYSGALKQDLRYSPSKCFDTFPFPDGLWRSLNSTLSEIGERYHEHRRRLMLSMWLGLTDVYNLFHSRALEVDLKKHCASRAKKDPQGLTIPEEHRARALAFTFEEALTGIVELRRLHVELDNAVCDAYGWPNLDLQHDFYEIETLAENDRVRYTISPAARKELLVRLLKENHLRAAQQTQLATSSHQKGKPSSKPRSKSEQDAPRLDL